MQFTDLSAFSLWNRMGNSNCCRSSSRQERATELYVVPGARRNPTQEGTNLVSPIWCIAYTLVNYILSILEGYTDPVLPAPHNVSAIIHSSYSIPVDPLTLSINTELTIPCSRTVWPPHHDSLILSVNRLRSASLNLRRERVEPYDPIATYPFRRKPTQHSMEEC